MSAAQLDEAFYHLFLPCMSLAFIGKICLVLPTGMQRGGGFSLIFAFLLPLLLFWVDSDTLPDHNVFLLFVSFSIVCFFGCLFVFSNHFVHDLLFPFLLFLSLMQTSQRIGRKRRERRTQHIPSWNNQSKNTFFFLGQTRSPITDHSIRYIDTYLSITLSVHLFIHASKGFSRKRPD